MSLEQVPSITSPSMSFLDKMKDMNAMRKQAKTLQTALSQETVKGSSANNFFHVTLDGNQNVLKVEIDEKLIGDKALLERSAKEALSRALDGLKKMMVSKFSSFMK